MNLKKKKKTEKLTLLVQVIYYNYLPSHSITPRVHFIKQKTIHITQIQLKSRHKKAAVDKRKTVDNLLPSPCPVLQAKLLPLPVRPLSDKLDLWDGRFRASLQTGSVPNPPSPCKWPSSWQPTSGTTAWPSGRRKSNCSLSWVS